jgi:hypothetical protein
MNLKKTFMGGNFEIDYNIYFEVLLIKIFKMLFYFNTLLLLFQNDVLNGVEY